MHPIYRKAVEKSKDVKINKENLVDFMIDYETGILPDFKTIALFQHLIDTGTAWKMQGSYGKMANHLIDKEVCHK